MLIVSVFVVFRKIRLGQKHSRLKGERNCGQRLLDFVRQIVNEFKTLLSSSHHIVAVLRKVGNTVYVDEVIKIVHHYEIFVICKHPYTVLVYLAIGTNVAVHSGRIDSSLEILNVAAAEVSAQCHRRSVKISFVIAHERLLEQSVYVAAKLLLSLVTNDSKMYLFAGCNVYV